MLAFQHFFVSVQIRLNGFSLQINSKIALYVFFKDISNVIFFTRILAELRQRQNRVNVHIYQLSTNLQIVNDKMRKIKLSKKFTYYCDHLRP